MNASNLNTYISTHKHIHTHIHTSTDTYTHCHTHTHTIDVLHAGDPLKCRTAPTAIKVYTDDKLSDLTIAPIAKLGLFQRQMPFIGRFANPCCSSRHVKDATLLYPVKSRGSELTGVSMAVNLRVLIASYKSLRSDFEAEDEKSSVVRCRRP